MKAIWSFWSIPHSIGSGWQWRSEKHFLLSWILSFETTRRHYGETALHTDDAGARLLADGLGLPFREVSTSLNDLRDLDPDWWMLGKLCAYRQQRTPFIHVDYDVYLWKPLPERLTSAAVFAQNVEDAGSNPFWYAAEFCEQLILERGEGVLPMEWTWYRGSGLPQQAASCGILGANDIDFLRRYAGAAMDLLMHPRNRAAFAGLDQKTRHNPLFEQFLLSAYAAYHSVPIEFLFDDPYDLMSPEAATRLGYTHLISSAKSDRELMDRLEQRVAHDYPDRYDQCLRVICDGSSSLRRS